MVKGHPLSSLEPLAEQIKTNKNIERIFIISSHCLQMIYCSHWSLPPLLDTFTSIIIIIIIITFYLENRQSFTVVVSRFRLQQTQVTLTISLRMPMSCRRMITLDGTTTSKAPPPHPNIDGQGGVKVQISDGTSSPPGIKIESVVFSCIVWTRWRRAQWPWLLLFSASCRWTGC